MGESRIRASSRLTTSARTWRHIVEPMRSIAIHLSPRRGAVSQGRRDAAADAGPEFDLQVALRPPPPIVWQRASSRQEIG